MRELKTEITINSRLESVWKILTDFEKYPEWNPFIKRINGDIVEGSRLEVLICPPGWNGMLLRPIVKKVEKEKEFRWLGRLLIPGIFDGEHIFEIKDNGDRATTFVHREIFRGILVPVLWNKLAQDTENGFVSMNESLKLRAEEI